MIRVAALFVATNGPYFNLPGVDPWDVERDARMYAGPHPVVAHPPCERWGRYWSGGPSAKVKRKLGDDEGCFDAALFAVRKWGGVLEHPEGSHAFNRFGLRRPEWRAGWLRSGGVGYREGWVCCVAQGNYGHRARKLTWLFASPSANPPIDLLWHIPTPRARLDYGFHSAEERRAHRHKIAPVINATRLNPQENLETPTAFRDVLIRIARSARRARVTEMEEGT
jgi:hypothetical protein